MTFLLTKSVITIRKDGSCSCAIPRNHNFSFGLTQLCFGSPELCSLIFDTDKSNAYVSLSGLSRAQLLR